MELNNFYGGSNERTNLGWVYLSTYRSIEKRQHPVYGFYQRRTA